VKSFYSNFKGNKNPNKLESNRRHLQLQYARILEWQLPLAIAMTWHIPMAFLISMVAPLIPNVNVITDFMAERIGRINSVFLALSVMETQRYQVLAFQVARLIFSSILCTTSDDN
jgi:hypothetical protein